MGVRARVDLTYENSWVTEPGRISFLFSFFWLFCFVSNVLWLFLYWRMKEVCGLEQGLFSTCHWELRLVWDHRSDSYEGQQLHSLQGQENTVMWMLVWENVRKKKLQITFEGVEYGQWLGAGTFYYCMWCWHCSWDVNEPSLRHCLCLCPAVQNLGACVLAEPFGKVARAPVWFSRWIWIWNKNKNKKQLFCALYLYTTAQYGFWDIS